MLDFDTQKKILGPILKDPKNHFCADCDTISPTWASLDYGVFLCSNCSGAHRSLGPTITRVRSANLDIWQRQWVNNMVLGNQQINNYWEADTKAIDRKPKMGATLQQISRYVFQKYVKKRFVKDSTATDPLTAYKSGSFINKPNPSQTASDKAIIQNILSKNSSRPVVSQKSAPNFKPSISLLDFDQDLPQVEVRSLNQTPESLIQQKPNEYYDDDEFTDFAQANTKIDSTESGQSNGNFINFETLMNQQIQSQIPTPSKHFPINIHHMYPPVFAQQKVYNGNYQQQQHSQMQNYNNLSMHHNYHNYHAQNHNYGMRYPNQGLTSIGNNYWN